jgi:hypothetical protein
VLVLLTGLTSPPPAAGQSSLDGLWTAGPAQPSVAAAGQSQGRPVFRLNRPLLEQVLAQVPPEGAAAQGAGSRITIPAPDGRFLAFRVERSAVMEPELARNFPGIDTFRGQGIDDPTMSVRFDRTPLGFHATVVTTDGVFFVLPERLGELDRYTSRLVEGSLSTTFQCLLDAFGPAGANFAALDPVLAGLAPSGPTLRQYRLAVAATGEYTQFFGSEANALAAIATTVNAVNAVYNVEVTTHLTLIGNNNLIVYEDPTTDPFPLSNKNTETQAAIDGAIGNGNYDIGHLFHVEGSDISGNAGCIACVCTAGAKGSGWSQGPDPTNADFIFVVAHEMGHQHGGTHTFNGTGCSASQYTASSAWEPGSGSTVMSYSSICGPDNVLGALAGDLYFHAGSRQQITAYTQSGGGAACGTPIATGNAIPLINAGPDFTIPQGTPFVLTATGSDPDGEPVTFTWEQFDLGPTAALSAVDDGEIPLFRSRPPTISPSRTFPRFVDLLSGSLFPGTLGEQLPSTNRSMTFRTTARDNRVGAGAADDDEMVVTVAGGPFAITSPGAGGALECAVPSPVTWDVGGGSVAPTVNILLSTNGGGSFPTTLAAATPNDGAQNVTTAPGVLSSNARVRIDAIGNIFFALSPQIAVRDTIAPVVTCPPPVVAECTGNNGVAKSDPQLAAFFAGASATDACDAAIAITDNAPALLPLGNTQVTFTGTDDSLNAGSCFSVVSVVDTTLPTISVSLNPTGEFPANHKMFDVAATVVVADTCDPNPAITLTSITSNEPDDGLGDGNTTDDVQGAEFGTADFAFQLRAERAGNGTGRIYTVTYTVTDGSGNTASASATVTIPHSNAQD